MDRRSFVLAAPPVLLGHRLPNPGKSEVQLQESQVQVELAQIAGLAGDVLLSLGNQTSESALFNGVATDLGEAGLASAVADWEAVDTAISRLADSPRPSPESYARLDELTWGNFSDYYGTIVPNLRADVSRVRSTGDPVVYSVRRGGVVAFFRCMSGLRPCFGPSWGAVLNCLLNDETASLHWGLSSFFTFLAGCVVGDDPASTSLMSECAPEIRRCLESAEILPV